MSGKVVGYVDSFVYNPNTTIYQWVKNGQNVGANSPSYLDSTLINGDSIWLIVTSSAACVTPSTVTSFKLGASVVAAPAPITLVDSGNGCARNTVLTVNGVSDATVIEWQQGGNTIFTTAPATIVAGGYVFPVGSSIYEPTDVFVDASGNLYVPNDGGDHIYGIEKFAPGSTSGVVVAGGTTYGSAANEFNGVGSIYVDAGGNIYASDPNNNRVQKWAPGATSGVTVAGGNGSGTAADQLNNPTGIVVDGSGNIYIADLFNYRVQKWAPGASSGVTVAGGNGAGSAANQLNSPWDVGLDANGNIYVTDDSRIQKWAPGATSGVTVAGKRSGKRG